MDFALFYYKDFNWPKMANYTTQNLIRIKLLLLFAEGPAYLIPNIL